MAKTPPGWPRASRIALIASPFALHFHITQSIGKFWRVWKRHAEKPCKNLLTCEDAAAYNGGFPQAAPCRRFPLVGLFLPSSSTVCHMEKVEHARLLRAAMVEKGINAKVLADTVGVSSRTVGNWISRKEPTMPSDTDKANLTKLLGDYQAGAGDPVEVSIRRSDLQPHRQSRVIAVYQEQLYEQQREVAAG